VASFLTNDKGTLSGFRVGLLISALGIIAVLIGFAFWQWEHQQRRSPLNIPLYPNLQEVQRIEDRPRQRTIVYRVQDEPEAVAAFYQLELDKHLGQNPQDPFRNNHVLCVRLPDRDIAPEYALGNGFLPYLYRCGYDNSYFGTAQNTVVEIQPGIRDDARGYDNTGYTYVIYTQRWSR
jgi:hypothetical protein